MCKNGDGNDLFAFYVGWGKDWGERKVIMYKGPLPDVFSVCWLSNFHANDVKGSPAQIWLGWVCRIPPLPPGIGWTPPHPPPPPPPPPETLSNYSFLWNKQLISHCKTVKVEDKKDKKRCQSCFLAVGPGPPWQKFLDPRMGQSASKLGPLSDC